ncbi:acid phosphatase [Sphingobium indicum]|uniref:acid phosphatase n=1 Tax=Sphingobium indicum TaxID=332055 RepID=UPI0017A4622D|nr:phosphatase PAP2 family protein [Sphingobium indicum]NYI24249.1 acid phosphatase (class A) [Sphingobium indicum]
MASLDHSPPTVGRPGCHSSMAKWALRSAIVCIASLAIYTASGAREPKSAATYLPATPFSIIDVIPPAPVVGDPRYEADRAIFLKTRALQNSDRWRLATRDVSEKPGDLLRDFSCAAGLSLTPEKAPRLTALLVAAAADTARVNNEAKNRFQRARPFKIDAGPICQPAAEVTNSYDYPSGHTTRGWTWATLLAQLLPERAVPILARGRAYGESRVVCGVHNASAVETGRLSASVTLTVMQRNPRFQADMRAALRELDLLKRRSSANALACGPNEQIIPSIFTPRHQPEPVGP